MPIILVVLMGSLVQLWIMVLSRRLILLYLKKWCYDCSSSARSSTDVSSGVVAFLLFVDCKKLRYKCAHAIFPNTHLKGKRAPDIVIVVIVTVGVTNAKFQKDWMASQNNIPPTASSITEEHCNTNTANVLCRWNESAYDDKLNSSLVLDVMARSTRKEPSRMVRHDDKNDPSSTFTLLLFVDTTISDNTSDMTQMTDIISRSNTGIRMRIGRIYP